MTLTSETVGLYAETLVRQAAAQGVSLDFSRESLATLDGLLSGSDPLYDTASPAQRDLVIFYAGCYLGEVLVRTLESAQWQLTEHWPDATVLVVRAQGGIQVRPFEKLHRRITEGGEGNSLSAFWDGLSERLAPLV